MDKFSLSERYRLELHWDRTNYERDGICELTNAYFSGPALMQADRINDNDNIMLDFYHQYIIITKNAYVGKLSWGEVIYNKDNTVSLRDAAITHDTELNRVPKLKDSDHLIIDTKGHETETHAYNLLYKTYVVNEDTTLYRFDRK